MSDKPLISFDYAIKYLLKNKGDYDIVEGFISALLDLAGYGPVKITALLESESTKESKYLKKSIADLVVEDANGTKYIVEIDRQYSNHFIEKACFNTSRLIVDSIKEKEDYSSIKKVFHISILYFPWGKMTKPLYHGKTIFREIDTEHPIDLHLMDMHMKSHDIMHIFPEYFLISVPLFDDVIKQEIDEWLYVMKNCDVKKEFKSAYMQKVYDRLSMLTMNAEEKDSYYRYMKEVLTQRDAVEGALYLGREEGIEESSRKTKIAIAKSSLQAGLELELISKLTGLSIEEIKSL